MIADERLVEPTRMPEDHLHTEVVLDELIVREYIFTESEIGSIIEID
jgi:hypothetical protein